MNRSVMNVVYQECVLSCMWSVMNGSVKNVCVMNGSTVNLACYELVYHESSLSVGIVVSNECGLL